VNDVLPVIIAGHEFAAPDFVGGDPALDFVNTVAGRDAQPRDRLDGYGRLVEWAKGARLLPDKTLQALARKARSNTAAAEGALQRAKALREAMFAVVTASISGAPPGKAALALLREHWVRGVDAYELTFAGGRIGTALRSDAASLDLIAAVIARRLVEHVLISPAERLRICQGPDCSWLFIDSSKAGRRRWCDMAVCGNAAKARRFHARAHGRARRRRQAS